MPATIFLEYARNGNRTDYENIRNARIAALQSLIFAECVENKGGFLDDITNGVWAICEESFWGVPAHLYIQKAELGLPDPSDPIATEVVKRVPDIGMWLQVQSSTRSSFSILLPRGRLISSVIR